ncbi:MAG TPA: mismatch-specific DNA-glycosylase [Nitrospiraceae bacterium]|jgi:TDG/mug DNA glycosylase family protein|nr:mismatch-specific DNA-glycosylase [Nitrospiraceae bacterium]
MNVGKRRSNTLPDHIKPGVRVLFVGINPGARSAAVGHHFAGYSNRFWKLLYESRLVPEPVTYEHDERLPDWGFGLTNLIARPSRGIDALKPREYVAGRKALLAKIRRYRPSVVALLGITLSRFLFLDRPRPLSSEQARRSRPRVGWQPDRLAGARVFVLPNPSGRNAHDSYRRMLALFGELRAALVDQPVAARGNVPRAGGKKKHGSPRMPGHRGLIACRQNRSQDTLGGPKFDPLALH